MEKLRIFPEEILARERVARRYSAGLADVAIVPRLASGSTSVWAQYTIRLASARREPTGQGQGTEGAAPPEGFGEQSVVNAYFRSGTGR